MKYWHDFIGEDNIVIKLPKVEIKSLENTPTPLSKEYFDKKIEEFIGLPITYSNRDRLQIIKQEIEELESLIPKFDYVSPLIEQYEEEINKIKLKIRELITRCDEVLEEGLTEVQIRRKEKLIEKYWYNK